MGDFSKRLEQRVHTKGSDIGYCVICGQHGKLTRDHVPPKACNNKDDTILQLFNNEGRKTHSQGGTWFKTLCTQCNSGLLGDKYDPELVYLSNEITNLALSLSARRLILPSQKSIIIKPQKIARAIIGHILAANSVGKDGLLDEVRNGIHKSPFSDALRYYFLNETASLPDNIDIYFWVYPSRRQVVIKNGMIVKGILRGNNKGFLGHIIKFLPLGFWILIDKPNNIPIRLSNLVPNKNMDINESYQMSVKLTGLPSLYFPESPENEDDDHILLLNNNLASIGIPKPV